MKNEEKYIEIQNSLRDKLDLTDKIIPDNIKTIAGVLLLTSTVIKQLRQIDTKLLTKVS